MNKIAIQGKEYALKCTLRMFFIFENTAGHPFEFGKLLDEYLLFYSCLLANNEDFTMLFDEFIAECDSHSELFAKFKEVFLGYMKMNAQLPEGEKKKKKQ